MGCLLEFSQLFTSVLRVGPVRGLIVNSGPTLATAWGCKPTLRVVANPGRGGSTSTLLRLSSSRLGSGEVTRREPAVGSLPPDCLDENARWDEGGRRCHPCV